MYDVICDTIHRELTKYEENFDSGSAITGQDIEHIDLMTHTLKSIATLEAMRGRDRRSRYDEYRRY